MKILPVIHLHPEQPLAMALSNASIAKRLGCHGVFLISNDGHDEDVIPVAQDIKERYPDLKVGVNLLGRSGASALRLSIRAGLDMTWADNCGVLGDQVSADGLAAQELLKTADCHQYFGGVAFKYQPIDAVPDVTARKAMSMGFIPTTSGQATGMPPTLSKMQLLKGAVGDYPLAAASGFSPDNIATYRGLMTHALVATGVGSDFYTIDPDKLSTLIVNSR